MNDFCHSRIWHSTRFVELATPKINSTANPGLCVVCGKTLAKNRTRYCGHECYRKFYLACPEPLGNAVCPICGKTFPKGRPSQIYCSKRCKYLEKNRAAASLRRQRDNLKKVGTSKSQLVVCNRCGHVFQSWDKTLNRRCLKCQRQVESLFHGAENSLLEGIID